MASLINKTQAITFTSTLASGGSTTTTLGTGTIAIGGLLINQPAGSLQLLFDGDPRSVLKTPSTTSVLSFSNHLNFATLTISNLSGASITPQFQTYILT